jgi:hypothetical protein
VFETYPVYCCACGQRFDCHPVRGYRYACSRACWDEHEWRHTLAILGKKYYPLGGSEPCQASEAGSGSAEATPAPSAESPTGASSLPTGAPPSAPAPRAIETSENPGFFTDSELKAIGEYWIVPHQRWPADPHCPTSPGTPTDSGGR